MRIIALSLAILFFNLPYLPAKAIHLFVAGDTHIKGIGKSVKKDCDNVVKSFSYIAELCKIPIHVAKITSSDKNLTYNRLTTLIKKKRISRNDVIVFYFSGHGSRDWHTRLIWPRMGFSDRSINSTLIIEKLIKKKAALTLAFIDCCNKNPINIILRDTETISSCNSLPKKNAQIKKNCRNLFFNNCGIIIASAAQPGELATCVKKGSYFTNSSLNTFFRKLQSSSPQWDSILEETKKSCYEESLEANKKEHEQYPHLPLDPPQTSQYVFLLGEKKKKVHEYIHHIRHFCIYRQDIQNPKDASPDQRFDENVRNSVKFKMDIEPLAKFHRTKSHLQMTPKRHRTPQFTLQPAGYCYQTSYQIRLLSHPHTRPLKVEVWAGRSSPYIRFIGMIRSTTPMQSRHHGPLNEKNFGGRFTFTIDKKHAHIAFEKDKQNKLQLKAENILPTSIWHTPLHKILDNIWRYDRDGKKKWKRLGIPLTHISTPCSIRTDYKAGWFHDELDATYVLRSKAKPFSSCSGMHIYILIRPTIDRHNKIRNTQAIAEFYPYKDGERCLVCYYVTKKGLGKKAQTDIKKGDTYLEKIAKKALEKSTTLYLKIKQAEKRLYRTHKKTKHK